MIERTKPDETKITANLPTASIEMIVREHQDTGSEVLTVSIRACFAGPDVEPPRSAIPEVLLLESLLAAMLTMMPRSTAGPPTSFRGWCDVKPMTPDRRHPYGKC